MTIEEGTTSKGGVNRGQPKSKRPAAPSGQNMKQYDDRWMCARHGALKIDQTYKLAFIRTPRKTRRCKKCREPVSYMSQAEAAELLGGVGSETIDYRRLLVRYMAHVIDAESVAYLDNCNVWKIPKLIDEELNALKEIETEARKEWNL